MKNEDLLLLAGVGLLAYYITQQNSAPANTIGGGFSITWPTFLSSTTDGSQTPAQNGMPSVNAAGPIVPGANAPFFYSAFAPELTTVGGSPSGWNAAGGPNYPAATGVGDYF